MLMNRNGTMVRVSVILLASAMGASSLRAGEGDATEGGGIQLPALSLSATEAYRGSAASLLTLPDLSGLLGQVPEDGVRRMAFKTGIGFTASPTTFLLTMQADFFLMPFVSLGPLMQFGIGDDDFIWGTTANLQFMFDLPMEELRQLKPIVNAGLGFVYMEDDDRVGDDEDWGLLLNWGFGLEYFLTPEMSVGTHMMFNYIPTGAVGEHFFFSWQVVGLRFQF